jgi:hypothetical protein
MARPPTAPLQDLLAVHDPAVAKLALAARSLILEQAPAAQELIYDAYNALSLAYGFTERLGDAFCHVAVYTHHLNLGFNRGADLDDPKGLLQGTGKRIRHLRVKQPSDLESPHVRSFVQAAIAQTQHRGAGPQENAPEGRSILVPTSGKKRRS